MDDDEGVNEGDGILAESIKDAVCAVGRLMNEAKVRGMTVNFSIPDCGEELGFVPEITIQKVTTF